MKLSIVTTLYKSSPYVDEFYSRITAEAQKITDDYEVIFVDDGSPDDSLSKAINLHKIDTKIKVIELSRNFGHHKAIMTGLSHAKGELIFLIDVDLEEEPELLGKFWGVLQDSEDIDVVYGVQESRKGGWFERWSGDMFYKIFNKLSSIELPPNWIIARLMTQSYINEVIKYKEINFLLGGVLVDVGFNQIGISVKKGFKKSTTYTLRKKLFQFTDSITSFSSKPLEYISYIGFSISSLSFIYILYVFLQKILYGSSIQGWTSLIASIWFLGGIIILSIGILGIYISKVFIETKQRPYSTIRKKYGRNIDE